MASLDDAFRPLAYRGGWSNSPDGHTVPKPSMELGPVSVSPRQPLDAMRFNGANMVPPPGGGSYADSRVGPATYSQTVDMTDPSVRQIARRVLEDLASRGMLAGPRAAPELGPFPLPGGETMGGAEHFTLEDAKSRLSDLMGNTAFVIGVFLFAFGSLIKNAGLAIAGAVFIGVPGALNLVKAAAEYVRKESGIKGL